MGWVLKQGFESISRSSFLCSLSVAVKDIAVFIFSSSHMPANTLSIPAKLMPEK